MLDSAQNVIEHVLDDFNKALTRGDLAQVAHCFAESSYWRDLLAFTWNVKTMEGREQIQDMLQSQFDGASPSAFEIDYDEGASEEDGVHSCWIKFETSLAHGYGHMRVWQDMDPADIDCRNKRTS